MSHYSDKLRKRADGRSVQTSSEPPVVSSVTPTSGEPPVSHFSAGVICQKVGGVWHIAGITDSRFPTDVRVPGGTNKNASWENPPQTLCRELGEELEIDVLPSADFCKLVHVVPKKSRVQYFYAVAKYCKTVRCGEFRDSDGATLTVRWVSLEEFWQRCFSNHKDGFQKAIELFARENPDSTFREQAIDAEILFHV